MKYEILSEQDWNILLDCVKDDICTDVKEGEYNGKTVVWYEKLYAKETIVLGTQNDARYFIR